MCVLENYQEVLSWLRSIYFAPTRGLFMTWGDIWGDSWSKLICVNSGRSVWDDNVDAWWAPHDAYVGSSGDLIDPRWGLPGHSAYGTHVGQRAGQHGPHVGSLWVCCLTGFDTRPVRTPGSMFIHSGHGRIHLLSRIECFLFIGLMLSSLPSSFSLFQGIKSNDAFASDPTGIGNKASSS